MLLLSIVGAVLVKLLVVIVTSVVAVIGVVNFIVVNFVVSNYPIALLVVFNFEDEIRLGDHKRYYERDERRITERNQRVRILTLQNIGTENRRQIVRVHFVFCGKRKGERNDQNTDDFGL